MRISASTWYEWVERRPSRRLPREGELIELLRTERVRPFVAALGARRRGLHLCGKGHDVARALRLMTTHAGCNGVPSP